ncbi:serine/threonine protein kinase [Streptomyces armeniacus]|uniref:Serine/threonine protein kinase n=1 Tax=Streptomyces armeniacus TaxID=83291 RepID=A0A345XZ73_9ACTN|nr:serine/threonine protein kinase [Streptomyces armeniacus]
MDRLDTGDPRWIGGYRLLGRLGEGGMGRVYLARSERGRTVAVKAVRGELARQPDFRRRFAQEITAAQRVGADWTAPVLDADTEAAEPWVATGYIAGPSLTEVVDRDYGPLPEHSVRALATGLVKALTAIHAAGLVHRDLKPSNVLITIDGPRVIDFGIARALDATVQSSAGLTRTGAVIGSPGFMSPEQVRGETVTPAADVFCLGAVLAYAATGRMPFGTADSGIHALLFRIAEEEPDLSGLSGPLHQLISACLTKSPGGRPTLETLSAHTDGEITGTWLPGEVLAQLGRHAVQLLDSEDPEAQAATATGTGADVGQPVTGIGNGGGNGTGGSPSTPPPTRRPRRRRRAPSHRPRSPGRPPRPVRGAPAVAASSAARPSCSRTSPAPVRETPRRLRVSRVTPRRRSSC